MKQKTIIALLAFFLLSGSALAALVIKNSNGGGTPATAPTATNPAQTSGGQSQPRKISSSTPAVATQPQAVTTAKSDNSGNYQPTVTTGHNPGPAPAGASGLPNLACSLTAQTNPDESISLLFYVQGPGFFSVQEKISGTWQTTRQNVFYAGTGGLEAGSLPAGADSITLRLLKIENGTYSSLSNELTVQRQEVISAGGLKTYRG